MNFLITNTFLRWSNEVYKIIHTANQFAWCLVPGGLMKPLEATYWKHDISNHRNMIFSLNLAHRKTRVSEITAINQYYYTSDSL